MNALNFMDYWGHMKVVWELVFAILNIVKVVGSLQMTASTQRTFEVGTPKILSKKIAMNYLIQIWLGVGVAKALEIMKMCT